MVPTLSVKANVAEAARRLGIEQKDLPKRAASALTWTAQEAKKGLQAEMRRVFDRPTRFTLNSLFLKSAKANDLTAVVWLKARGPFRLSGGNVVGAPHYLEPQVFGGVRPLKAFEKRLQRAGLLPAGMYAVPGAGAKLDSFGNMSRGQLVQILSQLRTFTEGGGAGQNITESRRSKRNVAKAGRFFVGRPGGGKLPLGVWQRLPSKILPVLIFVRTPRYGRRFKFYEVADRIARQQFPFQFERAAREAATRRAIPRAA